MSTIDKKKVMEESSCFKLESIQMLIIYGKTKQQFKTLNVRMMVIKQLNIQFSSGRMKDKNQSITSPETVTLVKQASILINMLKNHPLQISKHHSTSPLIHQKEGYTTQSFIRSQTSREVKNCCQGNVKLLHMSEHLQGGKP